MSTDDKESPNKESNGSDASSISDNRIEQSEKVEQAIQEKELRRNYISLGEGLRC
jgi:hypothetical protein